MAVNNYETHYRELENDEYANRLFVLCKYKNGIDEDMEITGKSILDIVQNKDLNGGMVSFQVHKKKVVLLDDIELTRPYDFGTPIYFGKRITAFEYYQKATGRVPVGMINEKTNKVITEEDLLGKNYVLFPDGSVEKNPNVGFKTYAEVLEYFKNKLFQEKNQEEEEKPTKKL